MKRWIGVCLLVLMLAGCAAPSESEPEKKPATMIPRMSPQAQWEISWSLPEPYRLGEEAFFSQERLVSGANLYGQEKHIEYQVGREHDCEDGQGHLVRYNENSGVTACLGDLGEGDWLAVSRQTHVGLLLWQRAARWLWLYAWDGKLYPLYELPDEPAVHIDEPMFTLQCQRSLYRGSLFSRKLDILYEIPAEQKGVLHPEPYCIGNDIWPITTIQEDGRVDYGTIVSAVTGKAYTVAVEDPIGPFIRRDWAAFFEARQADIDGMDLPFVPLPMEELIEEPAILK